MAGPLLVLLLPVPVAMRFRSSMYSPACPKGEFPSIWHNEIRDVTAKLLSETYSSVDVEPRTRAWICECVGLCGNSEIRT